MGVTDTSRLSLHEAKLRIDLEKLGQALRRCYDLPFLQNSDLAQLPRVLRRARREKHGLNLARALRKEFLDSARQITRRTRHSDISEIVAAIEAARLGLGNQHIVEIQERLGIPFPRDRIDLARYYAIRLVMEGLKNEIIADFLQVDLRTLGNYIAAAKEHIRLTLESR